MSKLSDKLSANMRTVKANQPQVAAKAAPGKTTPSSSAAGKTTPRPPAPVKAAPPSPRPVKTAPAKTVPGDVPDTGAALFPTRVWPD